MSGGGGLAVLTVTLLPAVRVPLSCVSGWSCDGRREGRCEVAEGVTGTRSEWRTDTTSERVRGVFGSILTMESDRPSSFTGSARARNYVAVSGLREEHRGSSATTVFSFVLKYS